MGVVCGDEESRTIKGKQGPVNDRVTRSEEPIQIFPHQRERECPTCVAQSQHDAEETPAPKHVAAGSRKSAAGKKEAAAAKAAGCTPPGQQTHCKQKALTKGKIGRVPHEDGVGACNKNDFEF